MDQFSEFVFLSPPAHDQPCLWRMGASSGAEKEQEKGTLKLFPESRYILYEIQDNFLSCGCKQSGRGNQRCAQTLSYCKGYFTVSQEKSHAFHTLKSGLTISVFNSNHNCIVPAKKPLFTISGGTSLIMGHNTETANTETAMRWERDSVYRDHSWVVTDRPLQSIVEKSPRNTLDRNFPLQGQALSK